MGTSTFGRSTLLLATFLTLAPAVARAQPITEAEVPPALRPWIPWVLDEYPDLDCTDRESAAGADAAGTPLCIWPSELRIELGREGCDFTLLVVTDRTVQVGVPGGPGVWPADVRVDGRATPVASSGERPVVRLEAGSARVEGHIAWDTMPDTLTVPAEVARIVVVRDGAAAIETRSPEGDLWLGAASAGDEDVGAPAEADSVRIEVHRQLTDGAPLSLVTRLTIRVAGAPRELVLGDVLPEGAVPVSVRSDSPARLRPSGELTLQIRPGTLTVEIQAFLAAPDAPLARPALGEPWPAQEVWVWVPNEAFRQVEVTGVSGIDPDRTTLPPEWRSYSAYLFDESSTMSLVTSRRGEPTPPPNDLSLTRSVWLDESGTGATVEDTLSLTMRRGFRIELLEGSLGRVSSGTDDLLITVATEGGRPGVEVRSLSSALTGEWRIEGALSSLPAVGWSEDASSSSTNLNVPPGWELMHASGVDRAPGTWTDRWTLLGFFALLLISIAVGRVFGVPWGIVAFVGVGLAYHEDGAPRWLWFALAALLALHRALGARTFERWARWGYVVVMIAGAWIVVEFATTQLRNAHYPVLAGGDGGGYGDYVETVEEETPEWLEEGDFGADDEGGMGMRREAASEASISTRYGIEGPGDYRGGLDSLSSNANWLDPTSVVQTGYGRPSWSWRSYFLGFDGPVAGEHRIALWLSPPWLTRLMALLRAVLALALFVIAVRARPSAPPPAKEPKEKDTPPKSPRTTGAPNAAAAATILALGLFTSAAHAQPGAFPPAEVLTDLGERLTVDPICGDHCAEASRVSIEVDGDRLAIEIEISASARAVYPLPGPSETWTPDRVTLDGRPADALVRLSSGYVHIRVPEGTHTIALEGTVARRDALTLSLGRAPRALSVVATGWETTGTGTNEHPAESIDLRRALPAVTDDAVTDTAVSPEGAAAGREELPTWVEIERRLDIGVRWTLESTVRRRSPSDAPFVVRVPLAPGESVTDANVVVEGGAAVVTLPRGVSEVSWTSVLEPAGDSIVLTAPSSGLLSERWRLSCSPLWHCETSGIAPTESSRGGYGTLWEPSFDPWPGESVTIALSRPAPMEGRSTTIESADLSVSPGARLTTATLSLSVRTSVATTLTVDVPAAAEISSLTVGGTARPIQRDGATVSVTLQPGSHVVRLEWQEPSGWSTAVTTPSVTLGGEAVNLTLDVNVTSDRWVLWISGPAWGPAVLFWPYLVMVLVVAFGLSRRKELLPKVHEWALLGLGLTQIDSVVGLFIVGFFFVLAWRKSDPLPGTVIRFDLRQLFVAGYALFWFGALVDAVRSGLLGDPAMEIAGPGSYAGFLHFFVDRTAGALPTATIISLPVFVFRVLMFVWALWLAATLVRWARPIWAIFADGGLWRTPPTRSALVPATSAATAAPAPVATSDSTPAASSTPEPAAPEATPSEPTAGETERDSATNDDDE